MIWFQLLWPHFCQEIKEPEAFQANLKGNKVCVLALKPWLYNSLGKTVTEHLPQKQIRPQLCPQIIHHVLGKAGITSFILTQVRPQETFE